VEPTNNWAERALRPVVIARKVSHRSKNAAGAEAFSTLVSGIGTLRLRGGGGGGRGAVRGAADREGSGSPGLTPAGAANQLPPTGCWREPACRFTFPLLTDPLRQIATWGTQPVVHHDPNGHHGSTSGRKQTAWD